MSFQNLDPKKKTLIIIGAVALILVCTAAVFLAPASPLNNDYEPKCDAADIIERDRDCGFTKAPAKKPTSKNTKKAH